MNRIPHNPVSIQAAMEKASEVHDALQTVLEKWIEREVAKGIDPLLARSEAASGLLSACLNQYFRMADTPADKGAELAVKVTMVLAAGIHQIQQEMRG